MNAPQLYIIFFVNTSYNLISVAILLQVNCFLLISLLFAAIKDYIFIFRSKILFSVFIRLYIQTVQFALGALAFKTSFNIVFYFLMKPSQSLGLVFNGLIVLVQIFFIIFIATSSNSFSFTISFLYQLITFLFILQRILIQQVLKVL